MQAWCGCADFVNLNSSAPHTLEFSPELVHGGMNLKSFMSSSPLAGFNICSSAFFFVCQLSAITFNKGYLEFDVRDPIEFLFFGVVALHLV